MNTHADKTQKNKGQSVSNGVSRMESSGESTFQYVDKRPEAIGQRKLQEMANNSPQVKQVAQLHLMANSRAVPILQKQSKSEEQEWQMKAPIQKKNGTDSPQPEVPVSELVRKNNTGLPDNLKSGIENLSGYSMDDVKVHYNSDKPATLQAHAYAQGTDIHIASGQEKHLPHEAWHVVQQKQGRVKPTIQLQGKVNVNDDAGLEKEADVMGGRSQNIGSSSLQFFSSHKDAIEKVDKKKFLKGNHTIQRAIGMEIESQNLNMWTTLRADPNEDSIAVPYGTKVLETTRGFDVEADDAGRVEFVTQAFPEEGDGLLKAVAAAAAFAKSAEQKTQEPDSFPKITEIGAGTLKTASDPWVGLFDYENVYAKPQVTLGMPLDKFIAVLKQIGENTKQFPAEKKHVENYWAWDEIKQTGGSGGMMEAGFKGMMQRGHFSGSQSALFTLMLQYIAEAASSGMSKGDSLDYAENRSQASDDEIDGLLIALNGKDNARWAVGGTLPTPYPKSSHPLMARTNFRKMLQMAQFQPADLKDLKGDILSFAGVDEGNHMYPFGYYSDAVKDKELYKPISIDKVESGPTVGQWLDSIFLPAPQDANPAKNSSVAAMGNRVAPHLPGTPEDRGLGAMGAKTEQINIHKQADQIEAPIFEYRLLEGVYKPDEWLPLALAILNAARFVYGHKEAELPN